MNQDIILGRVGMRLMFLRVIRILGIRMIIHSICVRMHRGMEAENWVDQTYFNFSISKQI
jgi:hypothetical protein